MINARALAPGLVLLLAVGALTGCESELGGGGAAASPPPAPRDDFALPGELPSPDPSASPSPEPAGAAPTGTGSLPLPRPTATPTPTPVATADAGSDSDAFKPYVGHWVQNLNPDEQENGDLPTVVRAMPDGEIRTLFDGPLEGDESLARSRLIRQRGQVWLEATFPCDERETACEGDRLRVLLGIAPRRQGPAEPSKELEVYDPAEPQSEDKLVYRRVTEARAKKLVEELKRRAGQTD
jgi:hypothetical protein